MTAFRRLLESPTHPLQDYVRRDDRAYAWRAAGEMPVGATARATRIHLRSQVWQGMPWKHELDIIRPARCRSGGTVLLLIAGDRGDARMLQLAARAAETLALPVALLFDIPNQPLFGGKSEDALIAHTFSEYLRTGDRDWPLLYPMVKSAVRAMDAIQELSAASWEQRADRFVVTGASKRGWTTWLTGAVDPRVVGIAPVVYDNLNLGAQMAQQLRVYGTYSDQVSDYSSAGLPQMLATREGRGLAAMIDPFALKDRLRLPKLLIHGSNDRYWTLESANLYFSGLPGDKHTLYVPNGGHGLREPGKVLATLAAFTVACAEGRTLPRLDWSYTETPEGLRLTLSPGGDLVYVAAWAATSATQDFRSARWRRQHVHDTGHGCGVLLPRPRSGYAALFGEVAHRWSGGRYCQSTTPRIVGPA